MKAEYGADFVEVAIQIPEVKDLSRFKITVNGGFENVVDRMEGWIEPASNYSGDPVSAHPWTPAPWR